MNLERIRTNILPTVLSLAITIAPIINITRVALGGLGLMPQTSEAVIPFIVIGSVPATEALLATLGLGAATYATVNTIDVLQNNNTGEYSLGSNGRVLIENPNDHQMRIINEHASSNGNPLPISVPVDSSSATPANPNTGWNTDGSPATPNTAWNTGGSQQSLHPQTTELPIADQLPIVMIKNKGDIVSMLDQHPSLHIKIGNNTPTLYINGKEVVTADGLNDSWLSSGDPKTYMQISWPRVAKGFERNGYASIMYYLMMIEAQKQGKTLISSRQRSGYGDLLWESLERAGLATFNKNYNVYISNTIPEYEIDKFSNRLQ